MMGRNRWAVAFGAFVILTSISWAEIRKPAVAGSFYLANKEELSYQINKFLQNVPSAKIKGKLIALIVPHAGYPYSGQVAAYAYRELEGRHFDRVILIGSSHTAYFDGISAGKYDAYETPLGKVEVDQEFINKLSQISPQIIFNKEADKGEHSLEVQLPFLQMVLKDFKIVPLTFGSPSAANSQALALALMPLMDEGTLIIASSDWSHYYPYEKAQVMDRLGIEAALKDDVELFARRLAAGECEACGAAGILTTMLLAPALGANKVALLQYANSGDVTGDRSRVVGYAAVAFAYEEAELSEKDKIELLKIARKTLESYLLRGKTPEFKIAAGSLTENRGAFVTLTKEGKLRGCIGYIYPIKPLADSVCEMVIAAAAKDRRFSPVTKDELKDIKIEISSLSRLEKVKDIEEIKIGRDGLYIIKGSASGLLLPQVAEEWGWSREQFLEEVCQKAGLPKDTWKNKDAILYRFTAEVFHE